LHHCWTSHGPARQDQSIFTPLLYPLTYCQNSLTESDYQLLVTPMAGSLSQISGWDCDPARYYGWIGVMCPSVEATVWLLRMLIVSGIMVRREESTLYLPTGNGTAPQAAQVVKVFQDAIQLWHWSQQEKPSTT